TKCVNVHLSLSERDCPTVGETEFAVQAAPDTLMATPDVPRRHLQFEIGHVFSLDLVALLQGLRCLDSPLHINLCRIALDIKARGNELEGGAQVVGQGVPFEFGAEENLDIPLVCLKDTIVAEEARLGQ